MNYVLGIGYPAVIFTLVVTMLFSRWEEINNSQVKYVIQQLGVLEENSQGKEEFNKRSMCM